jgi:trehalose 6-phosphate phosphatase
VPQSARLRAAVVADPLRTLLAVDFDGTLSPIVSDPAAAVALPEAIAALARIAPQLAAVAIITGRSVSQVVGVSDFDGTAGLERLIVLGNYGSSRWQPQNGEVAGVARTPAIEAAAISLPYTLSELGAGAARIEDKGVALAVHTRGLTKGTFDRLLPAISRLGMAFGLRVEPGREVIELRPPGIDKGDALRSLVAEFDPRVVVFAGDDLGDLAAFAAIDAMPRVDGFKVYSASAEQPSLAAHADVVVDGPEGIATWLEDLADALSSGMRTD